MSVSCTKFPFVDKILHLQSSRLDWHDAVVNEESIKDRQPSLTEVNPGNDIASVVWHIHWSSVLIFSLKGAFIIVFAVVI